MFLVVKLVVMLDCWMMIRCKYVKKSSNHDLKTKIITHLLQQRISFRKLKNKNDKNYHLRNPRIDEPDRFLSLSS